MCKVKTPYSLHLKKIYFEDRETETFVVKHSYRVITELGHCFYYSDYWEADAVSHHFAKKGIWTEVAYRRRDTPVHFWDVIDPVTGYTVSQLGIDTLEELYLYAPDAYDMVMNPYKYFE